MTLTQTRALTQRAQDNCDKAREAAEAAMEATDPGDARFSHAMAHGARVQAENVSEWAYIAATKAISEGARGGTLCSSKEEWDIYLYTVRAAAEAKLHEAVAMEAVKSLTDPNYSKI
jgi:hypothetical protein